MAGTRNAEEPVTRTSRPFPCRSPAIGLDDSSGRLEALVGHVVAHAPEDLVQ
jgi:hypothetical protein